MDTEVINPSLPYMPDVIWSAIFVVLVALVVVVLRQIVASRTMTTGTRIIWVIAVLVLPVIGIMAWFAFGPRTKAHAQNR